MNIYIYVCVCEKKPKLFNGSLKSCSFCVPTYGKLPNCSISISKPTFYISGLMGNQLH